MPGKTLIQAMADGDDLSKVLSGGGVESEPSTTIAPDPAPVVSGEPMGEDPVPIPGGTFSKEELDLLKPKPAGPVKTQPKVEPGGFIPGTNFKTAEDAAAAFKTGQRTIAKKDEEISNLRNQIEKVMPDQIKAGVKEELDRLLKEVPQQESEEEKALKVDDPEQYRLLQVERKIAKQDENSQNLLKIIDDLKKEARAKDITSEFSRVAVEKKVPANLLLAYGSLPQYASTSAEDLADIVIKDLEASGRKVVEPAPTTTPATIPAMADPSLRSPVTDVSTAAVNETIDIESVGEIGSPGWTNLRKKMIDVAFNRLHGGAR